MTESEFWAVNAEIRRRNPDGCHSCGAPRPVGQRLTTTYCGITQLAVRRCGRRLSRILQDYVDGKFIVREEAVTA